MNKQPPYTVIESRLAPEHVDADTHPEDYLWTSDCVVPTSQATAEVERLTRTQSEPGLLQYRIQP